MSEFRQMIERLRELYLRCEAESITLQSQQSATSTLTPGLSTTQTTNAENQSYYYKGFLDGIKFFQSCLQHHPTPLHHTAKEGDLP